MRDTAVIDQLAMLFSTDWFQPYRMVTGYAVQAGREAEFLNEARSIVETIVDGSSEYWQVSFDPARLKRTERQFWHVLDRFRDPGATTGLLRQTVSGRPPFEPVTPSRMREMRDLHDKLIFELDTIKADLTEWDRKIAALTPELPDYAKINLSHHFLQGRQWTLPD